MTGDHLSPPTHREVVGRLVAPDAAGISGEFTYSVLDAAPVRTSGSERRGDRRIRSHLREALARENRGRPITDCRIRDLSSRGARLQLDRECALPKSFLLREAGTPRSFLATLIWQVGREAGVKLKMIDDPKS